MKRDDLMAFLLAMAGLLLVSGSALVGLYAALPR